MILSQYFKLDKIKNKWICQVNKNNQMCNVELSNSGNTSGRRNHLESIDGLTQNETHSKSQQEESNKLAKMLESAPYSHDSKRGQKLNKVVLDFIIACNQPISLVEHPSFVNMLKTFDNRHNQRYFQK